MECNRQMADTLTQSVGDGGDAAACDAAVHGGWRGAQPVRPYSTLQLCFVTRVSTREVQQLLPGPIEHQGGTANVTLCTRQRRTALTCCNARLLFADSTCCLGLHARLLHVTLGILRRLLPHAHGVDLKQVRRGQELSAFTQTAALLLGVLQRRIQLLLIYFMASRWSLSRPRPSSRDAT